MQATEKHRKAAKRLLKALRAGDPEACERVRRVWPNAARMTLMRVQHVIAREAGFRNWTDLTATVPLNSDPSRGPRDPTG